MRKHRVFAGILAAVMLLGMAPSALAVNTAEYNGPNPGQKNHDGILLDKSATTFNGYKWTDITLTVSAPSDQNPVAVEFVLDGTSSFHGEGDLGLVKTLAEQLRSTFVKNENVYVGVTVFGNKAMNVLPMTTVPDAIDEDLADSVAEMLKETDALLGSNVQSGIRAGLEDLESAALPEGTEKYMVLVTDGGSYSWLDGTESVRNTYTANGETHDLMNSDAADGGYDSFPSLSALLSKDIPSAAQNLDVTAGEPLSQAVQTIKDRDDLYTNFETGVYWAAKELQAIPDDVNLFTVGRDYYADDEDLSALTELAGEFVDMAVDMDRTGLSDQLYGTDLSTAFAKIAGEMNVAVPAGSTIVDYMGKTQTDKGETEEYDFNLLTDQVITLRVGSSVYTGTLGTGNTITFGDGSRLVYTSGADEHITLTLANDMVRGGKVSLTFTQQLDEYNNDSGRHDVLTNVQAYLQPAGSGEGLLFPEPSLSYRVGGGGGGTGGGDETFIPDDDVPLADLNETDHYAYIIGGKDGLAHPQDQITRGEVATIYFRMLTDESRNELWSQSNPYTDVQPDTWCNAAVSTMTRAGVIEGFSDGTFRPYAPITRAQFAAIAVRFFEVVYSGDDKFSDIADHWARDYINKAAEAAIINGYSDGTFRPNQNITRAQAMAIFNRVLGRAPDKDHMLPGMTTWPDNMDQSAWYYADVQEATNSHDYEIQTDSEGNTYEVWTSILPVRDWAAFENEWATANSASNPGEVISVPVN